jgi:hypothetical protein
MARQSNFHWQIRDHLLRKKIRIPAAAKIKKTELGSGVATAGATAMPAPWRSKLIGLRLEFSKSTFERSMPLDPGGCPLRVRTARVPMFEAPGPGPSRVSAGFLRGEAIPPVEVVDGKPGYGHRFKLTHGVHRFYCSLAAKFTHVPIVRGFDMSDPFA